MHTYKMLAVAAVFSVTLLLTPGALAQTDALWEQYQKQLDAVNQKYNMPAEPVLTDVQWEQYDAKMQPIHEKQDALYKQLDELDKQSQEIGKEFGFTYEYPVLTEEQWAQYDREINAVWAKYDAEYNESYGALDEIYMEKYDALLEEFDLHQTEIEGAPDAFYTETESLYKEYVTAWAVLGDYTIPAEQKADEISNLAVNFIPAAVSLYEKHGYEHPTLTEQQITSFDNKLSELQKKYNDGTLQ